MGFRVHLIPELGRIRVSSRVSACSVFGVHALFSIFSWVRLLKTHSFKTPTRSEPAFRLGDSAQDTSRVRPVVFEYSVVKDLPGVRLQQASPEVAAVLDDCFSRQRAGTGTIMHYGNGLACAESG
jgi:hypothetical protein